MPRATLDPPPAPARNPETTGAAPHVPVRAPFSRAPSVERGARVTGRGVALSVGAHVLLALAVWLAPAPRRAPAGDAPAAGTPAGQVSYVDIGAWPGQEGGGAPAAAVTASDAPGALNGSETIRADSVSARVPAPSVGPFPRSAPSGIPGAGAGGRTPRVGGAPVGGGAPTAAGAPASGNGAGNGRARSGPAGGRLGTEYGDERLVVTPEAAPRRPLTDQERVRQRIADRIREMNDSTAEEQRRARAGRNWTVKDRSGREWGIGDGGVPVIAGRRVEQVRIKPPIYQDRDAQVHEAEARRQTAEIDRQADDQDRDRYNRERTRAIRERADREREQKKREGAPGNP